MALRRLPSHALPSRRPARFAWPVRGNPSGVNAIGMADYRVGIQDAPPIALNREPEMPRRRQISVRWLVGTFLTGCAGAALMSGALYTAFDRELHFARAATIAEAELDPSERKGDRAMPVAQWEDTRQIIEESELRTVGDKEFIRIRPYVRVSASLKPVMGDFAEVIPAFDPLKLYADAGAWDAGQPEDEAPAAQTRVKVTTSPLPLDPAAFADANAAEVEIDFAVREALAFASDGTLDASLMPDLFNIHGNDQVTSLDLSVLQADIGDLDGGTGDGAIPAGGEATELTEDAIAEREFDLATIAGDDVERPISYLVKHSAPMSIDGAEARVLAVERGDTLMTILVANGSTAEEARAISAAMASEHRIVNLAEGQEIVLHLVPDPTGIGRTYPVRVSLRDEAGHDHAVAMTQTGEFVAIRSAEPSLALRQAVDANAQAPNATVFQSIYATLLAQDIPEPMIEELIRVFSFDVDYQRRVSADDRIELFFSQPVTSDSTSEEEPELLFAEVVLRGEPQRFYRFRTADDGTVDFYDEEGRSAKKFLMRKPMSGGQFRSGFGMRRHPILRYRRMHNGVDWAARTGTPIMAAGNGVIELADWKSGYGRHVQIRHANGYKTTYSHMSGFGRGIADGVRVRQGQVIGYVGSSGLSTGPHLHYEVLVNGRFVDPMRIRLPRGRVLDGRMLAAFEREKARIDGLLNRAPVSTEVASVGN